MTSTVSIEITIKVVTFLTLEKNLTQHLFYCIVSVTDKNVASLKQIGSIVLESIWILWMSIRLRTIRYE